MELKALPKSFYNKPTPETWTNFEMLLKGARWLNDMLTVIGGSEESPVNWDVYAELLVAMQGELAKLGQAVENEDHVLIGKNHSRWLDSEFCSVENGDKGNK